MIYKLIIFLFVVILISCNNQEIEVDKKELLGGDFRLFQHTLAWNLANAVENQDTAIISEEVNKNGIHVDYRETVFGQSLLILAVKNKKYTSLKKLLSLGAKPNLQDRYNGTSALIEACKIGVGYTQDEPDTQYIKLLLKYGGNPNIVQAPEKSEKKTLETPLISAINKGIFDYVKILVENGADVNYSNQTINTPLTEALKMEKMDIALYLLKSGADFKVPTSKIDGKVFYIADELRTCLYKLNSMKYIQKMEIVTFLKQHGIDYHKSIIPENIEKKIRKKYPNDFQNYMMKY